MQETVFLTQSELAKRWRFSPRTLEGWRDRGIGPRYYKIGNRVLYHIDDIEAAERANPSF
ncbi:MAG: helix-turn-helix transcriptional regulator [Sphingorhabdus sp.]